MADIPHSQPVIRLSVDGGIAWIIFDNPNRMNALSADMWAQLPEILKEAQVNQNVRVIVLRGEGRRAFSAGADISEFATARSGSAAETYNQLNHQAFLALEDVVIPTIAMVHGYCLGGGLGLAMSCDLRVCDERALFAIPAARLGIGYHPRWLRSILAAVSGPRAKELLFTGNRFDTDWALRSGLINEVVVADELEDHVRTMASQICANAPLSIKSAKRSIDALVANPALEDLTYLETLVDACFESEDYKEGQRAFMEKRKPEFKGL